MEWPAVVNRLSVNLKQLFWHQTPGPYRYSEHADSTENEHAKTDTFCHF
jgi:hypothetical protein